MKEIFLFQPHWKQIIVPSLLILKETKLKELKKIWTLTSSVCAFTEPFLNKRSQKSVLSLCVWLNLPWTSETDPPNPWGSMEPRLRTTELENDLKEMHFKTLYWLYDKEHYLKSYDNSKFVQLCKNWLPKPLCSNYATASNAYQSWLIPVQFRTLEIEALAEHSFSKLKLLSTIIDKPREIFISGYIISKPEQIELILTLLLKILHWKSNNSYLTRRHR